MSTKCRYKYLNNKFLRNNLQKQLHFIMKAQIVCFEQTCRSVSIKKNEEKKEGKGNTTQEGNDNQHERNFWLCCRLNEHITVKGLAILELPFPTKSTSS